MPDNIKGRVAFRTVVVRTPGGGTHYWFTDKRFSQGDTVDSFVASLDVRLPRSNAAPIGHVEREQGAHEQHYERPVAIGAALG